MRIAVYENLPPGGALRASFELGRQLIRRGHELDLFRLSTYSDKGPFDLAAQAHAVNVSQYRPLAGALDARLAKGHLAPRSYTLFGPLKRLERRLAKTIEAGGYDVVLAHPDAMTDAPYVLRWLDSVPTVYYCQEPFRFTTESGVLDQHRRRLARSGGLVGPLRLLEDRLVLGRLAEADRESARHARVIVVNSVYSRERVSAAYGRNAIVCYLGIDTELFSPADPAVGRRHEVLSIGAPIEAKGHLLSIAALGSLPPQSRPAFRVVLPRSIEHDTLERAAREHGVTLAVETGLSDPEVVDRYRRALMTVCAGRLEPFGLTALESMGCGTPVVAVREAGYRESVVDQVTGILVEPDAASVAAGIARLVEDKDLASRMGTAGRRDVLERWTWHRSGDQLEAILQDAARR